MTTNPLSVPATSPASGPPAAIVHGRRLLMLVVVLALALSCSDSTDNSGLTDEESDTTASTATTVATAGEQVVADPVETPVPTPIGNASRTITNADQGDLANGFTVPAGEIWEFDASQDVSIEVSENVVVHGILRMRPTSPSVEHFIHFVDVDESQFVGGGMGVVDSDVGLRVVDDGQLDLVGSQRSGWLRLAGDALAGDTTLNFATAPTGWQVGDEISIVPTAAPASRDHFDQFDVRLISAIDGQTVTVDEPLSYDHPLINEMWTAEVANLTRNVRIEGSGTNPAGPQTAGRAHVFVRSSKPQTIMFAQFRHVGPRQTSDDRDPYQLVNGRYGLHFHHNMEGSRGTVVDGVIVRDYGSRGFVPHGSHGITIRDSITYDGWGTGYWWDSPGTGADTEADKDFTNDSDDLLYDHNMAAIISSEPTFRGFNLEGFKLATGDNVELRDSVAVGIRGNVNAAGFAWPAGGNHHPNNTWQFSNNIAHNNKVDGIFIWQNDENQHVIQDFAAYHNGGVGIDHGAYKNGYQFRNLQLFGNGDGAIIQHASPATVDGISRSDGYHMSFENVTTDGLLMLAEQNLGSSIPVLYKDCSFSGVVIENADENPGLYDFVDCGLDPSDFDFRTTAPGTRIRVQDDGNAFELDDLGTMQSISPFYP